MTSVWADHHFGTWVGAAPALTEVGPTGLMIVGEASPAVGRSLAEIDLRAATGVTVLTIQGPRGEAAPPTGAERLAAGDRLVAAGSEDALARARRLLVGDPAPERRP